MTIIATCGHKLKESEGMGTTIAVKDYSKDGSRAVAWITVCDKCLKWYKRKKLIFMAAKEIQEYLIKKHKNKITDILEIGYPNCLIERDEFPISVLIKTEDLIKELFDKYEEK